MQELLIETEKIRSSISRTGIFESVSASFDLDPNPRPSSNNNSSSSNSSGGMMDARVRRSPNVPAGIVVNINVVEKGRDT